MFSEIDERSSSRDENPRVNMSDEATSVPMAYAVDGAPVIFRGQRYLIINDGSYINGYDSLMRFIVNHVTDPIEEIPIEEIRREFLIDMSVDPIHFQQLAAMHRRRGMAACHKSDRESGQE